MHKSHITLTLIRVAVQFAVQRKNCIFSSFLFLKTLMEVLLVDYSSFLGNE